MDEFIEQWSVKRPRCRALLSEPLRRQAEWLQSPGTALLSGTLSLGTVTAPFPGAFPEHGDGREGLARRLPSGSVELRVCAQMKTG